MSSSKSEKQKTKFKIMCHKMAQEKKMRFKKGSKTEKIHELVFNQKKTEDEVAKVIHWPKEKVHNYALWIKRRMDAEQERLRMKQLQNASVTTNPSIQDGLNMASFIPKSNGYISRRIGGTTDVKILEQAYNAKMFVLITGETGTGKTHLIRHFAFVKQLPYARVNLNGGTTVDELIGHWIPKADGGFRWQDGLLTTFVRNGGVIALDEVNACPAEILFALHSLTDDERTLVLQDKDGEVLRANPNFFLVATMNPDYEGTKPLNQAFKDRFQVKLDFDYSKTVEVKLIADNSVLELAAKLRVMQKKGEISTPISTRMLLYYESNKKLFGENLAVELFLNNFEQLERKAIENVIEMTGGKNGNNTAN